MPADVSAVIMAGGQGSRMAVTQPSTPKPLVEVAGRSLLEFSLRHVLQAGVRDVHLVLRHEAQLVAARARALPGLPRHQLTIHVEAEPLGTVGSLFELRGIGRTLLVVNVDLLSAIDLGAMLASHRQRNPDLTIATHDQHERLKLGEVLVGPDGHVYDYLEKPVKTYRISSGTYLIEPSVLALLQRPEWLGFHTLARRVIQAGLRVVEWFHAEPWLDVNDADDLARAHEMIERDPAAFGLDLLPGREGGRS